MESASGGGDQPGDIRAWGGRWKRARCLHFPSMQAGLDKFQVYLDGFSPDPQALLGVCEPTSG